MKYLYELPKNASGFMTETNIGLGFFELLENKKYDEITINDICDTSGSSKTTFYRHFQDKYELLTKCIYFVMADFEKSVGSEISYINPLDSYLKIAEYALDYLQTYKKRILNLIADENENLLFEPVHTFLYLNSYKKIKMIKKMRPKLKTSTEMLAEFFTGGIVSITKWLLTKNNMSKNEVLDNIKSLISFIKEC